jgi:hypothetical protein
VRVAQLQREQARWARRAVQARAGDGGGWGEAGRALGFGGRGALGRASGPRQGGELGHRHGWRAGGGGKGAWVARER